MNPVANHRSGPKPILGCLLAVLLSLGAGTVQAQSGRFSISPTGDTVVDSKTNLTWGRCSVGQTWANNACSGTATPMSYDQAMAYAKSQPGGWRVPDAKELVGLVDRERTSPSIDVVTFPGTVLNGYWTSSPMVGDPDASWAVNFITGALFYSFRDNVHPVRLVK